MTDEAHGIARTVAVLLALAVAAGLLAGANGEPAIVQDEDGDAAALADDWRTTPEEWNPPEPERRQGPDRFATAAAVSQAVADSAETVYLTTGLAFPDALAGGPVAGRDGHPILLTLPDRLPDSTATEVERLAPQRIVVLGGESAVSRDVADTLAGLTDGDVVRRAGATRFETAADVAEATFPDAGQAEPGVDPLPADLTAPDGQARQLEALVADAGGRMDFVADELVVVGGDDAAQAVADRWDGTVVRTTTFDTLADHVDVDEVPDPAYLVRVDPPSDFDGLADDIRAIVPDATGAHRASSERALGLLAIAAEETAAGNRVAVNPAAAGDGAVDRDLSEAPAGPSGYDPNPFNWRHFDRAGEPHTGVVEAWRALAMAGVSGLGAGERVGITVLDGGFAEDADWPAGTTGNFGSRNPMTCTDGAACPWAGASDSDEAEVQVAPAIE